MYIFNLFILSVWGLSCSTRTLLQHADLVVTCGLSCGMQTSLGHADLVVACMQDIVPRPGIKPQPPALGVRSLTHWPTREVLTNLFLMRSCISMC